MTTFKARARTIDMLGRQQIAGIPTAISELFKNAHDAYAKHVEIDYYRSDGLFVLRDDGEGMTRDGFVNRWLTIGTEGKFDPARHLTRDTPRAPRPRNGADRPILGEKGIGRLAIAIIGPQVLVLTRPRPGEHSAVLTAAFINWEVFEWPGINLDEIEIPVRSFDPTSLPSIDDVLDMVGEFRSTVERVAQDTDSRLIQQFSDNIGKFQVNPQKINACLQRPNLDGDGHGTHFFIQPASTLLNHDLDGDPILSNRQRQRVPPFKRTLLGFSNTMVPHSRKPILTAFRDHKTDDAYPDELLADDHFFTPEEFDNADHRICGEFNSYGQFRGSVSIYGEEKADHVIAWPGAGGKHVECGPFSINFAAFEGQGSKSTIPREDHARLSRKADQLGGLYIYRNGVRVLPYGDTDFDWLDIEVRRSKSAHYYYFSHRKMFGAIEIDIDANKNLREKAGREGFQENLAYRQFKSILQNFILQLAADFFREDGAHFDTFERRGSELAREDAARKKRQGQVRVKKRQFSKELDSFFDKIQREEPQRRAKALTQGLTKDLQIACQAKDSSRASVNVLSLEKAATDSIRRLEEEFRVVRPRIGLSRSVIREWNVYEAESAVLQSDVFQPLRNQVRDMIRDHTERANLTIMRRVRADALMDGEREDARKVLIQLRSAAREELTRVCDEVNDVITNAVKNFADNMEAIGSELQQTDLDQMTEPEFSDKQEETRAHIQFVSNEQCETLRSITEQLKTVNATDKLSLTEQVAALEQRNLFLEEQADMDAQMAQIGMAVEVISHEFSGAIGNIHRGLHRLKSWADANPRLARIYQDLRINFDHLDGYLNLFTPLHRRLHRVKIRISGSDISEFLSNLFRDRLQRHAVHLVATPEFQEFRLTGYPSSFFPVFVNLVDNSIHWLVQQNSTCERVVTLDTRDGMMLVADTGPGIDVRDQTAIFELGFTRKPGGRGMGLHIARESLRRVGYQLELVEGKNGAVFSIAPTGAGVEMESSHD